MAAVRSVNVGAPQRLQGGKGIPTGIGKVPVPVIEVRDPGPKRGGDGSGVAGDFIGDRRHHGGTNQAVYAVAREELDWWAATLGREVPDGMFGENLTTEGLDVDAAVIGELWRFGTDEDGGALLRVAGPRIPCHTFRARMGVKGWLRRFTERGRTGAYLSVVVPGVIRAGHRIEVLQRPSHGIDVPTAFRAFTGDLAAAGRVLEAGCLDPLGQAELAAVVERRP